MSSGLCRRVKVSENWCGVRWLKRDQCHAWVALKIGAKLLDWLEQGQEGHVGAEVACLLSRPDLIRLPAMGYVGPDKLLGGIPDEYRKAAPDLAIGVVSPSETWDEVQ